MINTTDTARYLGIIDSKLKLQSHISLLEKKLARSVGIPTELTFPSTRSVIELMLFPYTFTIAIRTAGLVCNIQTHFTKIKRLQNKAIRAVTKTKYTESITPVAYGDLFNWCSLFKNTYHTLGGLRPLDPPFVAAMLTASLPITNEDS